MSHHDFRFWRSQQVLIVATIVFFAVLLLAPLTAAAKGANKLYEIAVFTGFEYLGDPPRSPQAEYNVRISNKKLRKATYAALEFKVANSCCGTKVAINGREYHIFDTEEEGSIVESDIANLGKVTIPIPVGALNRGDNSVIFKARFFGGTSYDDFAFGEVYLILNQ